MHFEFALRAARLARAAIRRARRRKRELAEGVRLRGSIDLVEKHVSHGVLRVTDHKTGKLPETIPAYTGGGRCLQPLLYGLAAEKLLGRTVECGRLFYATQRGGYQTDRDSGERRARRRFWRSCCRNIDGAIAAGFLPPVPEKDACGICDYRAVCGPYEEQRAARARTAGMNGWSADRNSGVWL